MGLVLLGGVSEEAFGDHVADAAVHSSGRELGYAERTSDFSTAVLNNHIDVTGLVIEIEVADRPIALHLFAPVFSHSAAGNHFAFVREASSDRGYAQRSGRSAGEIGELNVWRRMAPSPGVHTYKATVYNFAAGTVTLGAAASSPSFLRAVEC